MRRLTKDEQEWIHSFLPKMSDQFRPELLLERRPTLEKALKEMTLAWDQFCVLSEELNKMIHEAFEGFTQDESERFVDWDLLVRIYGEEQVEIEKKMWEQMKP